MQPKNLRYRFFKNKDENVHRYAVRGGKDREREKKEI